MNKVFIEKAEALSDSVKFFTLKAIDGDFSFVPGQFFSFVIPREGGKKSVRAYSFASLPSDLPKIEIIVRQVVGGVGTSFLNERVGQEAQISAAQGDFTVPEEAKNIAFVASGVGIAPVRAQIHSLIGQPDKKIKLIYRHRNRELLFEKEWREFEGRKNFSLVAAEFERYNEPHGRILADEISPPRDCLLVVGPPDFVRQNTEAAKMLGYGEDKIIVDIWES